MDTRHGQRLYSYRQRVVCCCSGACKLTLLIVVTVPDSEHRPCDYVERPARTHALQTINITVKKTDIYLYPVVERLQLQLFSHNHRRQT